MTEMSTPPENMEIESESSTPLVCATATGDQDERSVKDLVIHTWEITVSPKGDITDEFLAWFEKTYKDDNVFAVTEQDKGHKHLHALMQFSNGPRKLANIRDSILRVVKKMHPGSVGASVYGTVCYSMKWYTDYLRKEESATQLKISNGFDPRKFEAALPSEEDQKILQAAKGPPVIGAYWRDHELKWIEFSPDSATVSSAAKYLNHRMFVSRDLEPIKDMWVFDQVVLTLYKYRNQFAEVEARTLKRAAADCDWNETTSWYEKKEKREDEEYHLKKWHA